MKRRGRRFLAYSLGTLAAVSAVGRLAARRDRRRADPEQDEPLGAIRGEPRQLRGPRASTLYTERFPGGPGTVVFTHGWCLTEAVWHYQKRDLPGGRFSVVTWDLPGHGHSQPMAPRRLTRDLAVDALARVVDEYADDTGVVLVGHSLGGVITLGFLAKHPDLARQKVRGAVLVSTPMLHFAHAAAGRWPGAGIEARALGRIFQAVVDSDTADRILAQDVGKPEPSRFSYQVVRWGFGRVPSPSHVRFIRDVIASVPPDVRADTYATLTGYDMRPELPAIRTPTLVMIGQRDRLVNPHESRDLAARLPRARTLEMPDVGHAAFMEAHEWFNAELRRFAGRRLASPRRKAGSA